MEIKKLKGIFSSILLVLTIVLGFGFSCKTAVDLLKTAAANLIYDGVAVEDIIAGFESEYNNIFSSTDFSLNAFSTMQKILCKHETRNFEVLRSNDDTLYLSDNRFQNDEEIIEIIADQYQALYEETISYGGKFLYVQVPYKNCEYVAELDDYATDLTETSEDLLDSLLVERGIPVLDLRDYEECTEVYRTDHHWTVKSGFYAATKIAETLDSDYGIDLSNHECYGDISNYEALTYENSFLGSIGVKVGPYYVGKDDFTIYNPLFDTDLNFYDYRNGALNAEYSGDFWNAYIDETILDDETYDNKYNSLMKFSYIEMTTENNLASNDYRGLLITHSYGRAMGQYLSLDFKELRQLDPQIGRYNESYIDYIREYQPDVVIVMYNNVLNIGDGYWEEYISSQE